MGEHEMMPMRILYVSPLRQLKMYESGLELCETEEIKSIMQIYIDIQRRECLRLSDDMMRLCFDTEIGQI